MTRQIHRVRYRPITAREEEAVVVRGVSTSGYPYELEITGDNKFGWMKVLTSQRNHQKHRTKKI